MGTYGAAALDPKRTLLRQKIEVAAGVEESRYGEGTRNRDESEPLIASLRRASSRGDLHHVLGTGHVRRGDEGSGGLVSGRRTAASAVSPDHVHGVEAGRPPCGQCCRQESGSQEEHGDRARERDCSFNVPRGGP